jgi:enoyl-CoA hydratase
MHSIYCQTLEDGILEIRLNRPERLNALNPDLIGRLIETFEELQYDRNVRVAILTGEGKGFCSGADLQEVVTPGGIPGTEGMGHLGFVYKFQEYLCRLMLAIHECDKPVVAAVNGPAVGGGLGLALASDIRIASKLARFCTASIHTGLSAADVGSSYFLPRLIGAGAAADMMLTGRMVGADEAAQLRLVSAVCEPEALPNAALALARQIRQHAEYGVWMTKKTLWSNVDAPSLRQALELENRTQVLGTFTGGMEDAMKAFATGQPPTWKPL